MWRRTPRWFIPLQFFNETFFRPKQVLSLTPQNYFQHLSQLPPDATLIRRHRAKFYVLHDSNVIGVYSPMMCLPLPLQVPAGGVSIAEYVKFLQDNDRVMLVVATKTSVLVAIVNKNGKAELGPRTMIGLPDEHQSIRLNEHSRFFGEFFGFVNENYAIIDTCSTFWLKRADDMLWSQIVGLSRDAFADACLLKVDDDQRWIPTTPYMYFPRIFNFKTRCLNEDGAIECMRHGELALA